jgi:hypothetical protein
MLTAGGAIYLWNAGVVARHLFRRRRNVEMTVVSNHEYN